MNTFWEMHFYLFSSHRKLKSTPPPTTTQELNQIVCLPRVQIDQNPPSAVYGFLQEIGAVDTNVLILLLLIKDTAWLCSPRLS